MKLACSHDAFQGTHEGFNRIRQAICDATGEMSEEFMAENFGVVLFLVNSCTVGFNADECKILKRDLSKLLDKVSNTEMRGALEKFINGCDAAIRDNEMLRFIHEEHPTRCNPGSNVAAGTEEGNRIEEALSGRVVGGGAREHR